jgi:hypothetical protein
MLRGKERIGDRTERNPVQLRLELPRKSRSTQIVKHSWRVVGKQARYLSSKSRNKFCSRSNQADMLFQQVHLQECKTGQRGSPVRQGVPLP